MKILIKDFGEIGFPWRINLRVILTTIENLENNTHDNEKVIFEGKSEDIPQNIGQLHYYKVTLNPVVDYYVINMN